MDVLTSIFIFSCALAIIWFFGGVLVNAVGRISKRLGRSRFIVSFFVLGAMTSISEISVAIHSAQAGVPQISVGNLIGASFVILILIVPLLAVTARGIEFNAVISRKNLALAFAIIALPAVLVIDGNVTPTEGALMLLAFVALIYSIHRQQCSVTPPEEGEASTHLLADFGKVAMGGVSIYIAAHFLVEQSVFFASALGVPASLIGLILLSVGTNVPELVVAARSIALKSADVAIGDYLGSAATNTLIFGVLAASSAPFLVEPSEFWVTTLLLLSGSALLYLFTRKRAFLSRSEGVVLLAFYGVFIASQLYTLVRFSGAV